MKRKVGIWIDNKKSVIFTLANDGASIKRISSENKDVPFSGGAQEESAEDQYDKRFTGHLNNYYDEVISYLRDAESILIFGPGEAMSELKKRLEVMDLHTHIVGFEIVDKMTDNQIVAKVRQHFLN
jgi:hypothetical protein